MTNEFVKAQKGDRAARNQLVEQNLGLVYKVARRYQQPGVSVDDLVQEGTIGLMQAIKKFDYRKGVRFSSYAMWWIRRAISNAAMAQTSALDVPLCQQELMKKIRKAESLLTNKLMRTPTTAELAADLSMDKQDLEGLLSLTQCQVVSLDQPGTDESDEPRGVWIADEWAVNPEEHALRRDVSALLDYLSPREQLAVRLRFGLGAQDSDMLNFEAVGRHLGTTKESARQTTVRALEKLRAYACGGLL